MSLVSGLPGRILGALGDLGGLLLGVGRNLIQGFINGISNAWNLVARTIRNLFGGVVDLVKGMLGIHSPSRVYRQIGDYAMQSLEQGLRNTTGVHSAIDSLGRELASTTLQGPTIVSSTRAADAAAAQAAADQRAAVLQGVSQMSAADQRFFRELFAEFAGSLTITDGVIASAANSAARLVKARVR